MYGWRARIGFIYPASGRRDDDYHRLMPEGVSAHFTRVAFSGRAAVEDIRAMSAIDRLVEAGRLLAPLGPDCVAWADTSGSFLFGAGGDDEQIAALERASGANATTTSTAIRAALAAVGAARPALIAPYPAEVTEPFAHYLAAHGLSCANVGSLGLEDERAISAAPAESMVALARSTCSADADALVIACTDVAAIDLIDGLEQDLGVPVITANQATAWHALRRSGVGAATPGFGALFSASAQRSGR